MVKKKEEKRTVTITKTRTTKKGGVKTVDKSAKKTGDAAIKEKKKGDGK